MISKFVAEINEFVEEQERNKIHNLILTFALQTKLKLNFSPFLVSPTLIFFLNFDINVCCLIATSYFVKNLH